MKLVIGAATAIAAIALSAATPASDWSVPDLTWLGDDAEEQFAESRRICAQATGSRPTPADHPTPAERAALKGCDSAALYYGIGIAADPVAARKCAMIEREQSKGDDLRLLDGEGILMMVYANGRGAERDFDIAIHMACQLSDAPAAMEGRITRLAELRQSRWTGEDFESCDDITSGMSGGICAGLGSRIAEQERSAWIADLGAGWTPAQRALFDRVYQSFSDYAETAHALDCFRGTLQAACAIIGREEELERFLDRVEALIAGRQPTRAVPDERHANAATGSSKWKAMVAEVEPSDRSWYRENGRETVAARARFERELLAFAASVVPNRTRRQVRQFFSDL
ncbi:MAG TPA: hypothetical protein VM346_10250 [Sphingomicrobium sp.]|nr:hypothetical protein [Sphingomicrobium sp.]